MKTIDEPMPICEAEMERLEDQLVEDCKSLGMAESIRDFLQEPFSEWMDELADESSGGDDSSPECRLSRNGAGALAIAMQQTMAVRDALLVSIIVDERRSSRDFLMGFMANPATRVIWRNPSTDRSVTHHENPTRNVATTAST